MKLSPKFLLLVAVFAIVMCGAFFMAGGPEKKAVPAPGAKLTVINRPEPVASASTSPAAQANSTDSDVQERKIEGSEQVNAEIIEVIEEAAVLYSPEGLPKIQPYLLHGDPEVRAAAIDGMVNLGESSGAALLRAAANLAPTAEDAMAMREAAAYLDLPPGKLPKRVGPSN